MQYLRLLIVSVVVFVLPTHGQRQQTNRSQVARVQTTRIQLGTRSQLADQVTFTAHVWVAKTGNDMNPGTEAEPKLTINAGKAVLSQGQILAIKAGTYVESVSNGFPSGTNWNAVTVITSYPGDSVIIRPSSGRAMEFTQSNQRYIEVRDLILDGDNTGENSVVKITDGADHIRLKGCEIRDSPLAMGVLVTEGSIADGSNNNEIIDCWIHSNGLNWTEGQTSGPPHGLYLSTDFNLVDGCRLASNPNGYGLHGFGGPDSNIIRNCEVFGNDAGILLDGNNNKVYNSRFWGHNFVGIQVGSGSGMVTGNKIFNNSFYDDPGGSVHIGHDNLGGPHAQGTIVQNNVCWATSDGRGRIVINQDGDQSTVSFNLTRIATVNTGTNNSITNNATGDPLFVNAVAQDFRVQFGSPTINAGTTLALEGVTVDADGISRPQGAGYDIGAYER